MSMVSPMSVVDEYKDKSIEEMIKYRDKLIRDIRRYEKKYIFKTAKVTKKDEEEWMICPSPDVIYQVNQDYLVEIIKLINHKFNESEWEEDDDFSE